MRKPRSDCLGRPGRANVYHVVSRVVDRRLVFGDVEKEHFREVLERQLRFSGLHCLAWCIMGNHFHLLLEVPDKDKALARMDKEALFGRLKVLSSEVYTRRLLANLAMWREKGAQEPVDKAAEAIRARLFDLSRFMQELKSKFTMWYNRRHGRKGTLWEERFKSVLVEGRGGRTREGLGGLFAVAAYIDLNPVRAGLCDDPKDYLWCGYAAAVAGDASSRAGLGRCVADDQSAPWRWVARSYRTIFFGLGAETPSAPEGRPKRRRGFSQAQIDRVLSEGGSIPTPELLRCRVRYFTEGIALGGRAFVEEFLGRRESQRGDPHPAGADWGELGVAGRLRGKPIEAPG